MTPPALCELLPHAAALPTLPEVVSYLTRALNDEGAGADPLLHHLNSEPAIVARLLAAANSVGSGLTSPIFSVKQAFLVLGINRIVSIVLAAALSYRYDARGSGFDSRLLWRHSLGVATCARVVAEQTGANPEMAFTAGLLHDIGQLLMFTASPGHYVRALELKRSEDTTLIAAERSLFGYDHAAAGRILATAWRLPLEISEAIGGHHEPDELFSEISNLIHVSEVLSHALDLGEQPDNRVPELSELACAHLGLSWPRLAGRFAEIEARYNGLTLALGV